MRPVESARGPTRTPDSTASRRSRIANGSLAGSRMVVIPKLSQVRPRPSPTPNPSCACASASPGITVYALASTTLSRWRAAECGTTLVIRCPLTTTSMFSRADSATPSHNRPACTTTVRAGWARVQVSGTSTLLTAPDATSTRRRPSVDWYRIVLLSPLQHGPFASSLVRRVGGPVGSPERATGIVQSNPSRMYAIFFPSGLHAGPSLPRVLIPRPLGNTTHRSLTPCESKSRISLRPSR